MNFIFQRNDNKNNFIENLGIWVTQTLLQRVVYNNRQNVQNMRETRFLSSWLQKNAVLFYSDLVYIHVVRKCYRRRGCSSSTAQLSICQETSSKCQVKLFTRLNKTTIYSILFFQYVYNIPKKILLLSSLQTEQFGGLFWKVLQQSNIENKPHFENFSK